VIGRATPSLSGYPLYSSLLREGIGRPTIQPIFLRHKIVKRVVSEDFSNINSFFFVAVAIQNLAISF